MARFILPLEPLLPFQPEALF